jgi:serine/threonine protein kinase
MCLAQCDLQDPIEEDRRVQRFIRDGARLYTLLLELGRRRGKGDLAPRLLEQIRFLAERAHRPRSGTGQWALLREESDSLDAWVNLLAQPEMGALAGAVELGTRFALPPQEKPKGIGKAAPSALGDADFRELFEKHNIYQHEKRRIDAWGLGEEYVQLFHAKRKVDQAWEDVNVKVYKLPKETDASPIRDLLLTMWEKERRLLDDLSSRPHSRGLTAFRGSHFERVQDNQYLLIVTEGVSDWTLRDMLDQREFGAGVSTDRGKLWRKLVWVIEAVNTLHRANYIHRNIRPTNVLVAKKDEMSPLKLANFEWSVYLQALGERQTDDKWVSFDYYSAPEILLSRYGDTQQPHFGLSFASDIYALGLLLFESLVRPLGNERDLYHHGISYDHEAHCRWIAQLRTEAATRLESVEEQNMIERMLVANPGDRETDLTSIVEAARRLVRGTNDLSEVLRDPDHPPVLVSLFWRGSRESLEAYLSEEIDLSGVGPTQDDLARFVGTELGGARIYRNGGDPDWPLLIEGRRVSFVAQPFEHEGSIFLEVPFFIVARFRDWKSGAELARLPRKVEMLDLSRARSQAGGHEWGNLVRRGLIWERLFTQAAQVDDDLRPEHRELHSLLAATAEMERRLWDDHVLPYRLVDQGQTDEGYDWALIEGRDSPKGKELSGFVGFQVARELVEFELSTRSYSTAPFMEGHLWTAEYIDKETRRVKMVRKHEKSVDRPPAEGYLRPKSLEGNHSLYVRRRKLLNRLEDDPYLLRSISEGAQSVPSQAKMGKPFNSELDKVKQGLVQQIIETKPLFVVQGPPGTGKTTLATEVIRQTLDQRGSTGRILVTCQAHAPLTHLLEQVDQALREQTRKTAVTRKKEAGSQPQHAPVILRLATEGRVRSSELADRPYGDGPAMRPRSTEPQGLRQFHPSFVANERWEHALSWEPGIDSSFPRKTLTRWREFLREHKQEFRIDIQRRLNRTANLVFVTANDRHIYELGEDSFFDLLIYEEAAKAYPLEVLAPMLHARRWLLIGDQDQLPPFNIESFSDKLGETLQDLQKRHRPSAKRTALDRLQLNDRSSARAQKLLHFFEYLFNNGEPGHFKGQLQIQWRMHPAIGDLLREVYYPFLRNGDEAQLRQKRVHPIIRHPCSTPPSQIGKTNLIWIDTPLALSGEEFWAERPVHGGGYRNPYEAHAIFQFLRQVETRGRGGFNRDMLLLSPYRAQVELLRKFTRSWTIDRNRQTGDLRDLAETVDSAQGREAGVVVVSLVRNNPESSGLAAFGFLTSENRSGVMFSRAESLLVIVGCADHFAKDPQSHINRVFRHIEGGNGMVIDAQSLIDVHSLKLLREHESRRRGESDLFRR